MVVHSGAVCVSVTGEEPGVGYLVLRRLLLEWPVASGAGEVVASCSLWPAFPLEHRPALSG